MERFRYTRSNSGPSDLPPGSAPKLKLTWTTPDGWKEIPASTFREVNIRFGENDAAECYLTRLPAQPGGIVSNVNRWRSQMGAEAMTEEEVNALPKKTLFGKEAILVTVEGTYKGVGKPPVPDSRLVGLVLSHNNQLITVKMTGPKDLVKENEVKFDAFCASLDERTGN